MLDLTSEDQMLVQDQHARECALDPTRSFLMQAPAGSGKTEVLIQRFLRVLSLAEHEPEEILAITFTKKAAEEMRTRVHQALLNAQKDIANTLPAHQLKTHQLASAVLAKDNLQQWKLLDNPQRLNILTIDALCMRITKQLPIHARYGANPQICQQPERLYQMSIQQCLQDAETQSWGDSIHQLLLLANHDHDKLNQLLFSLLTQRDQWLPLLFISDDHEQLRQILENNLMEISQSLLNTVTDIFPKTTLDRLIKQIKISADLNPEHSGFEIFSQLHAFTDSIEYLQHWQALTNLLMTSLLQWRKTLNKNQGFISKTSLNSASKEIQDLHKNNKDNMLELIQECQNIVGLENALQQLAHAPGTQYSDDEWKILTHLLTILPILTGYLKLSQQKQNQADYTEITLAAITGLQAEENSNQILSKLDNRIKHILIDEFQDTSLTQLHLFQLLISQWSAEENRSLFLVGDPMQSIYRFRQAEVKLFTHTKQSGIGSIVLAPLQLKRNFRSAPAIVNWVNYAFANILPKDFETNLGCIQFESAIANQTTKGHVHCHLINDSNPQPQAQHCVALIKHLQNMHPEASIAVLVRARTHLAHIIPELNKNKIPFAAVDIEPLQKQPCILDLISLTYALYNLCDRLHWLSVLRAPWCGLGLQDLHVLSQFADTHTIWENLQRHLELSLSNQANAQIKRCLPIFEYALSCIHQQSFSLVLETTWQRLGGPSCLNETHEIDACTAYFSLIENMQLQNIPLNSQELERELAQLYAPANSQATNLNIMTIHKSKGLEFDIVILPCLERLPSHDDQPLLRWDTLQAADGNDSLIMSALPAQQKHASPSYKFLSQREKLKQTYEYDRLLYVGVTRAKQKLYLLANISTESNDNWQEYMPKKSCWLNSLWPVIKQGSNKYQICEFIQPTINSNKTADKNQLSRLDYNWSPSLHADIQIINKPSPLSSSQKMAEKNLPTLETMVGNVTHYCLEILTKTENEKQKDILLIINNNLERLLLEQGMPSSQTGNKSKFISNALNLTCQDKIGMWLLNNQHTDSYTEYAITQKHTSSINSLIIDRCFKDQGICWIVDYKTSQPKHNESMEVFYTNEKQTYISQLEKYANALQMLGEKSPIKLGLYFPVFQGWIYWNY